MMITDFLILDGMGLEIEADAHETELAFCCPDCGHPVLADARERRRGSDESQPTTCKGCGEQYFLDVRPRAEKLYIHRVGGPLA
jgi:predicted RNA-binding Zn-ribbon protein involved in translation (DUF1610 family)